MYIFFFRVIHRFLPLLSHYSIKYILLFFIFAHPFSGKYTFITIPKLISDKIFNIHILIVLSFLFYIYVMHLDYHFLFVCQYFIYVFVDIVNIIIFIYSNPRK